MKNKWYRPWTFAVWLGSSEEFEPEEPSGPASQSRFGPKGFWGWLVSSEEGRFGEEPVMQPVHSQFGEGGFWKWLLGREEFVEDPEMILNRPRFGQTSFLKWLFSTTWSGETPTDTGPQDEAKAGGPPRSAKRG